VLGINIGEGNRDDGVAVLSVSPGGGAEAAGIKSGDVLTQIAGKQLNRDGGTSPREKLLATLRETKPGDKLVVSYRRDGKVATATVTTDTLRDRFVTMRVPSPGTIPKIEHLPPFAFARADGVFGSTELAPLTPKLGQYFGAEKGLLVVRAPSDSRLQLEDGDVILDIDGRVPSSPSHALRILGSYQAGEKLKVNVMRAKKRMTFDITIPEDTGRRGYRYEYSTPAPAAAWTPAVPVPAPAPPAPTAPRAAAPADRTI